MYLCIYTKTRSALLDSTRGSVPKTSPHGDSWVDHNLGQTQSEVDVGAGKWTTAVSIKHK